MRHLRSARLPALLLLGAAVVGLIVANSPLGPAVLDASHAVILFAGTPWELSAGHTVTDGLLTVFFFIAAAELRRELTVGDLRTLRRAATPGLAAAGGVVVPIALYLLLTAGTPDAAGWPVPTATDIAFALGVLAVFGKGLPSGVRVFLLALAILDDIVGIVFIAVLFTDGVDPVMLAAAAGCVAGIAVLSRLTRRREDQVVGAFVFALAVAAWACVLASGVHPTIAGVAVGLALAPRVADRAAHVLEPWVNAVILPLFAFTASLVVIPASGALSPAFWAVLVALPVGKVVGIVLGGLGARLLGRGVGHLPVADLLTAGALGGIGFTVSLLLSNLAFETDGALRDSAILGVLTGSAVSLIVAVILVSWRARVYRLRQEGGVIA